MSDTPIQRPPSPSERVKAFIGDLARPVAIISTSLSASWATVTIAGRIEDGNDGALFIAAVFAGLGALYGFKAHEVVKSNRASADVAVARAQAAPSPSTSAPDPAPATAPELAAAAAASGELPADERLAS